MKITLKIVFDLFTTENANSYLVIFQEFLYDIQWETSGNFPFNFTAVLDQFPTNLKTKMSQKSLVDLNMCAVPEPSWCSKSTRTLFKAGECAKSYLLNRQRGRGLDIGLAAQNMPICTQVAWLRWKLKSEKNNIGGLFLEQICLNCWAFFFLKVWEYFELGNFYCTYSWFNSYFFFASDFRNT